MGKPFLPLSTASAAASAPSSVHCPGFSPHACFSAAPNSCRPRHRRRSPRLASSAYRNRPAAVSVSWLPFITMSSPPALRASNRKRSSRNRIAISSLPRSSWSPTCTTVVSPPHHLFSSSSTPPARSASVVARKSPCTSPIATRRRTAGRNKGPSGLPGERRLWVRRAVSVVRVALDAAVFASPPASAPEDAPVSVVDASREDEGASGLSFFAVRAKRGARRGGGGCTACPPAWRVSTNASTNGDHTGASVAHRGSRSSGRLRPTPIAPPARSEVRSQKTFVAARMPRRRRGSLREITTATFAPRQIRAREGRAGTSGRS